MAMRYGWFSAKAASSFGANVYRRPDGSEVIITVVCDSNTDSGCKWDDIICVGEVTDWIRRASSAAITHLPLHRSFWSSSSSKKPMALKEPKYKADCPCGIKAAVCVYHKDATIDMV